MIFAFLLIFWNVTAGFSQSLEEDLGKTELKKHDSIYFEYFKSNRQSNIMLAKQYALKSHALALRNRNYLLATKSANAAAYCFNAINVLDSAYLFYKKGISLSQKHGFNVWTGYLYNDLGNFFERTDKYDSALHMYQNAYEVARVENSPIDQAIAKQNISLVFMHLEHYDEALIYLKEAVSIKRSNQITQGLALNLTNIGVIYKDQKKYEESIGSFNEAEKICAEVSCNAYLQATLNYNIGDYYYRTGQPDKAYKYFVVALTLSQESNNKKTYAETLFLLSDYKIQSKSYGEALKDLEEALLIAKSISLRRSQRDIYQRMSEIYLALNDLDKVVIYQNRYIQMKDSIFNETLANHVRDILLVSQKKESEIIINEKENELQKSKIYTILIGIITILSVLIGILLYGRTRSNKKMQASLESQVRERTSALEYSNQELKKSSSALEYSNRELKKSSSALEYSNRELQKSYKEYDHLLYRLSHDIRGPIASLIGLSRIGPIDANILSLPAQQAELASGYFKRMELMATELDVKLKKLREVSALRNAEINIEKIDLASLVTECYNTCSSVTHFPLITFQTETGQLDEVFSSDREILRAVITKLLENSVNYANMSDSFRVRPYIKVSWSTESDITTITVEDNGHGISAGKKTDIFEIFMVASETHGNGLGLFMAQMGCKRLGGKVVLAQSSNPTKFKIILPKPGTSLLSITRHDQDEETHSSTAIS